MRINKKSEPDAREARSTNCPVCPRCGDPMRLARKFPRLKPLTEMHFYLCGRCGNVETIDNSPKASP
jgi:hypothetical protein